MAEPVRLHPDDIEAIAVRVAALLNGERARPSVAKDYLTTREIADRYGVSMDWVYDHQAELEAVPIGNSPRPRLRFPALAVERFMTEQAEMRRAGAAARRRAMSAKGRSLGRSASP